MSTTHVLVRNDGFAERISDQQLAAAGFTVDPALPADGEWTVIRPCIECGVLVQVYVEAWCAVCERCEATQPSQ